MLENGCGVRELASVFILAALPLGVKLTQLTQRCAAQALDPIESFDELFHQLRALLDLHPLGPIRQGSELGLKLLQLQMVVKSEHGDHGCIYVHEHRG